MGEITVDSLLTVTGVTLVVGLMLQGVKVMVSGLTTQWLRRIALILGIVLMLLVTFSSGVPEGTNAVLFGLVAAVNGIVAGLAAGAAFDTIKYGEARVVTNGSGDG